MNLRYYAIKVPLQATTILITAVAFLNGHPLSRTGSFSAPILTLPDSSGPLPLRATK